jgi:hypothetical protein
MSESFLLYFNFLTDEEKELKNQTGEYSSKAYQVFAFSKPYFYFRTVDHLLIIISFYMALWVVNFTYAAVVLQEPWSSNWRFFSILPGIASMALYPFVVRSAFYLRVRTSLPHTYEIIANIPYLYGLLV